jgi:general secretion pathway protein I
VALAIVAIALLAASRAAGLTASAAHETKLRVLAGFVAENQLSELAARRVWPLPGVHEGIERQAGVEFLWRRDVSTTPHPQFRRVEVRVALSESPTHELRRLIGVLPREQ